MLALLQDRDGGAVGRNGESRAFITSTAAMWINFDSQDGLSANKVKTFYEDRERWDLGGLRPVGIESFHRPQVVTFSTREGLSVDNVVSVVVSSDDTVWLANGNSLDSIKDGPYIVRSIGHRSAG